MVYWQMALHQLRNNWIRTLLTVLGLLIGTAALIVVLSLGEAGKLRIQQELQSFGINLVWVKPQQNPSAAALGEMDMYALARSVRGVERAYATQYWMTQVKGGGTELGVQLVGTQPGFEISNNVSLFTGRFLTETDVAQKRNVMVISDTEADKWFGYTNALGENITVGGTRFLVIGVYHAQDILGSAAMGSRAFVPITVMQALTKQPHYDEIVLVMRDTESVHTAMVESVAVMEARRSETGIVRSVSLIEEMKLADSILSIFMLIIASIAAMALLVGGIGVMNILIITVRERRQEIGIRKALGATDMQILLQFIVEAIVIAGAGGLLGIGLGALISALSSTWIDVNMQLSWQVCAFAAMVSVCIGLFFGIYPARKASQLSPMEALRQS